MIEVYRVEDEQGRGPYVDRAEVPHADAAWATSLPGDLHPLPWQDGIEHPGETWRWRFGFASLGAFCAWFNPQDRAKIKRLGLKLARYVVPSFAVKHGRKQVIFMAEVAERAEWLDPTTV